MLVLLFELDDFFWMLFMVLGVWSLEAVVMSLIFNRCYLFVKFSSLKKL